jgi:hypothetical protein
MERAESLGVVTEMIVDLELAATGWERVKRLQERHVFSRVSLGMLGD